MRTLSGNGAPPGERDLARRGRGRPPGRRRHLRRPGHHRRQPGPGMGLHTRAWRCSGSGTGPACPSASKSAATHRRRPGGPNNDHQSIPSITAAAVLTLALLGTGWPAPWPARRDAAELAVPTEAALWEAAGKAYEAGVDKSAAMQQYRLFVQTYGGSETRRRAPSTCSASATSPPGTTKAPCASTPGCRTARAATTT